MGADSAPLSVPGAFSGTSGASRASGSGSSGRKTKTKVQAKVEVGKKWMESEFTPTTLELLPFSKERVISQKDPLKLTLPDDLSVDPLANDDISGDQNYGDTEIWELNIQMK